MRLKRLTAPGWVELYDGAALFCHPATTLVVYAARASSAALLVDLMSGGIAVTKVGAEVRGMPDLTDANQIEATRQALFVICLAELTATNWRNIKDGDGNLIPFDPAFFAQIFADPAAADAFSRNYLAERHEVALEGNV